MKNFSIASDFKIETIDSFDELNQMYEDSKVIETYGQLAPETFFGSGRAPKDLPVVDMKLLEKYVNYSLKKEIEFNYVINATTMANDELTVKGYKKIESFLKNLQDIGVTWITLTLPSLIEISSYVAPNLKIKASTLCQINSPTKAEFYEKLGIKRIVLDEDVHRKFDILKNIRKVYSGDIEIIVNSYCLGDCPYKMFHFNSFSHSNIDKEFYPYFVTRCMALHLNPENYLKLNWIRPEDIHHYTEIGIKHFKLQGRTTAYSGKPAKAVKHYIDEQYDGNLINLLELFSETKPMTISGINIDNRQLNGFFDKFVQNPKFCTKLCNECSYCKKFTELSTSVTRSIFTQEEMQDLVLSGFPESLKD